MSCSVNTNIKEDIVTQLQPKINALDIDSLLPNPTQPSRTQAVRIECQIDPIDLLSWLSNQDYSDKIYWNNRNHEFEVAGIGVVDSIAGDAKVNYEELVSHIQSKLSENYENLRYYGGISFSGATAPMGSWQPLGACRFILPQFEILKTAQGQTTFCCNLFVHPSTSLSHLRNQLESAIRKLDFKTRAIPDSLPKFLSTEHTPNFSSWESALREILALVDGGELEKIVLARKTSVRFAHPVNPFSLLKRINQNTSNCCYHYCFQTNNGLAFIGVSPERLYKRQGSNIFVDAVAGTIPRGQDENDDHALGEALMNSEKDRREHQFVVDNIKQTLARLGCRVQENGSVSLLKLNKIQHLTLNIQGILPDSVSDTDVLKALHPTSAVGGWPTKKALEFIRLYEPFCRGWYAGPVGWLGSNNAELAVAIRSGLVNGNQMDVYTGAGIVRGSKPEEEWREMDNKLASFIGKALMQ